MRGIYKVEIKRAIVNRSLLISIIIGTIITVSQVVMCVIPTYKMLDFYIMSGKGEYPASVFNSWIGGEGYTFHPELYNILIPFLACLPYAGTLYSDKKSGYCKNIYVKTEKKEYYKAKFIAVFLSGGIAVTIPLIINLYLTALIMPSLIPDSSSMSFPGAWANSWNMEMFININISDGVSVSVKPNEKTHVKFPFCAYSTQFKKSSWSNIGKRDFYVVLSSYPVKNKIKLEPVF